MVLYDTTLIRRWMQHPFPPLKPNQILTNDCVILELPEKQRWHGNRSQKRSLKRLKDYCNGIRRHRRS